MAQQGRNKGVTGLIDLLQPGTLANIFVEPFATTGNLIGYNNWATSAELGSVSPVVSGGFVVGVNGQTTAAQNTGAAALDPTKDFTLSFTFKKLAGSQNTDDRIVIEIGDVDGYSINIEIGYSTSEGVSADQVSIVVGDSTAGIITGTTVAAPWGSTHTLVFAVKHLMASTITVDGVLAANVSISHITDLIASTIYILGEEPSGSPLAAIGNMIIAGNSTAMPPIQAQIVGFGSALTAKPVLTTGPGDAQADTWYGSNVGGSGSAHGKVQSQQSPYPPTLYNLQGTITHQADTGCTISFPALITKMETERDASTNDTWTINVEWTKNGPHVVVWNGIAVSYAQPELSIKEVNDGSAYIDDPNALTTSAQTHLFFPTMNGTQSAYQNSSTSALIATYLAGAVPPRDGLKVDSSQAIRLDDNAVMLLVSWAMRDSDDNAAFPQTNETRAAMRPWTSNQAAVIDASDTMSNQATSLWSTFQSVAFALGLRLSPLTDGKRLVVYEFLNPGSQVQGYTRGGGRYQMARINGGTAQLYIAKNKSAGSGQRIITFQRQWVIDKPIRRFSIFRNITGTTIPEQYPTEINSVALPLIGQANDGSFLGLATGSALYEGPLYSTNLALSGSLPFFMGYEFYTDAVGLVSGIPPELFMGPQRLATACTASGWVNITPGSDSGSAIGVIGSIVVPSQASFAAFLA